MEESSYPGKNPLLKNAPTIHILSFTQKWSVVDCLLKLKNLRRLMKNLAETVLFFSSIMCRKQILYWNKCSNSKQCEFNFQRNLGKRKFQLGMAPISYIKLHIYRTSVLLKTLVTNTTRLQDEFHNKCSINDFPVIFKWIVQIILIQRILRALLVFQVYKYTWLYNNEP